MKTITTVMLVLSVNLACAETVSAERLGPGATDPKWPATPEIPAPVAVSPTARLALKLHAVGAQIYTCATVTDAPAGAGPTYRWKLKEPEATLFDASGTTIVGTHVAGPTWRYKDGSMVQGTKVAEAKAPGQEDIPWLLIRAVSHQGQGLLAEVTYAQRVNTSKGKAPADGCDARTQGREARADYSADYFFYTGGIESAPVAGGSPATRAN